MTGKLSSGYLSTIAGTGTASYSGDGGLATSATLHNPFGISIQNDDIYVADHNNNRIRKFTFACHVNKHMAGKISKGFISTIVGSDTLGHSGDGGLASSALINGPVSIHVISNGDIYFAELGANSIRMIFASNSTITTIAGIGSTTGGYSGDGGLAVNAQLKLPSGVFVSSNGDVFIADRGNCVIRKLKFIFPFLVNMTCGTILTNR